MGTENGQWVEMLGFLRAMESSGDARSIFVTTLRRVRRSHEFPGSFRRQPRFIDPGKGSLQRHWGTGGSLRS